MQSVRLQCTRVTSPVHPKPFAAESRHRIHSPVDEHPKLGLVVPGGQRPGVQAGPVGLVSLDGGRLRRCACRGGYPRGDGDGEDHVGRAAEVRHPSRSTDFTVHQLRVEL